MLHGVELMTFDHVLARAEQLITRYEHVNELETVKFDELQQLSQGAVP